MGEAEVVKAELPIGVVEGRPGVTVVTQENFNDYVDQQQGKPNPDPEAEAAAEFEQQEEAKVVKAAEPKEGDLDGSKVYFRGKWVAKHDFNYRVHLKTEEAKAELKAELEKNAKEAKEARETAEKASRERDELKAKYEPPPSMEVGPEPDPSKYTDIAEYSKARDKWAVDNYRAEEARNQAERQQKEAVAAQQKRWQESETALISEVPDYSTRIANAPGKDIPVSNELRDAIIDSELGPKLRLHLAENPDVLKDLLRMPVGKMLKQVGKIETALGAEGKTEAKTETKTTLGEVQMSKAPAPITPIRGGNSAPSGLKFDAAGNWTGTPEEWKAARAAGKIR